MEISFPDTAATCCLAPDKAAAVRRTPSSGDGAHELGAVSAVGLPKNSPLQEQPGKQRRLPNTKGLTRRC